MANSPKDVAAQTEDAHLHTTKNDTKNNAKAVSMQCLEARLADSIDLGLVTKQAHWNLKGPQFIGVHLLLDKFRDEQDEWTDSIAERIVQLGGTAKGTVQEIMSRTALKPYPTDTYKIADHLAALIERYASCANAIRQNIDDTADAGDAGTADLFTEVSRGLDKQLWFLEAHVQEPSGTFRE
jgi:starvation-inducible DNA-binding protein